MHCGAIGSQRVWVAVSTPSCATGTGRADHRDPRHHPHPLARQARYIDPDGIRRTADVTFATRPDAERWLAQIEREIRTRLWVDPHEGKVLFEVWALRWFASRVDLKPKTVSTYENLLRTRVLPAFGRRQIGRIRPIDVQEWIATMQREGRSASRIRQSVHLFGSIMKSAVTEGLVPSNPSATARLPRLRSREMHFFSAAEVERLAASVRAPYSTPIYVLAYGGLRFGELAALRRNDCELERGRVRVDEAVADVSGELHFGTPKNHQNRYVTLPPFLCAILRTHLEQHVGASHDALVFTSPNGEPLRYGNFYRRSWKRALQNADLPPVGLHVLRHTCASLLVAHGAPIKAVQAQLGHQSDSPS